MSTGTSMNTSMNNGAARREARKPEKMQARRTFAPPVDIYENADELLLVTDMPGVSQEGISVNLEKRELLIEGKRSQEPSGGNLLARESEALDYRRSFLLPQGIDAEKVSAELRSGVLYVKVPKAAAVKPRQIQVKIG